jgi:hypothetical protein
MGNLALTNPTESQHTVAALVTAVLLDEAAAATTQGNVSTLQGQVSTLQTQATAAANATGCVKYASAGAIAPYGTAVLKTGTAGAMTLVAPPAGATLTIVAADAHAYTVTTPTDAINGTDDTATFGGAVGDSIQLASESGVWITVALNGVTLSEV